MNYVPRTLWRETSDDRDERFAEDDVFGRQECLVILGEPGMGKTELLKRAAAKAGVELCTARQLINRADPWTLLKAPVIFIDALDEVASQREGDAVDLVIQKLGAIEYPRFIISCRVADWQAATSVAAIREQYAVEPLQLHLDPLGRDDQFAVLSDEVGEARATELIEHFLAHGLDHLGNPQNLELVARLPRDQPLPTSRGALFQLAVESLRKEHRHDLGRKELASSAAMDAAGAAFAALILTGASTIRRGGRADWCEGELPAREIDALADGNLSQVLGTRLFAGSEDGFTYWHRRIGEFVGAAWLARRADTPAKRRRLLQLFQSSGLVPTSLRGLHAWLARDPRLADPVIASDPMGFVEYGDADALAAPQARALFHALEGLAKRNPRFWRPGTSRARILVTSRLVEALRVIGDRQSPVAFRLLLLEQITEAREAEPYRDALRQLVQDRSEIFDIRWQAAKAWATLEGEDWPALVEGLRLQADLDSVRLAYDMMRATGLAAFTDRQIAEVVLAYDGLVLCALPRAPRDRIAARFWNFPELVPPERLGRVIDALADYLGELLPREPGIGHNDLIDAYHGLVLRRLELDAVTPLRLWRWLQPMKATHSYRRDKATALAERLRALDEVRRAIQRHVLLDDRVEPVWRKHIRLARVSAGLALDEADVVDMLGILDSPAPGDDRWFEVLTCVPHDTERGGAARAAADRLVSDDILRQERISQLTVPVVHDWEIEAEREARADALARAKRFERDRDEYGSEIERLRSGDLRLLVEPAGAYVRRYCDLWTELPAHERVAEWLGPEIAEAAHEGFEAFLRADPPRPNATRMALSFANDRRFIAGDVIVAALAERLRLRAEPFADLPDERLMAGLFEVWNSHVEENMALAERLESDLRARGTWAEAIRLFIGTQLRRKRGQIVRLRQVMHADEDADLATTLAIDWLRLYPDVPVDSEAALIDRILHSPRRLELTRIGEDRRATPLDERRRRNWDAVEIIIDVDPASARLGEAVEPELIWSIRDRVAGGRRNDRAPLALSPRQMLWIVAAFRQSYPPRPFPSSGFSGDTSPWDATSFISDMISRLGEETSDDAFAAMAALTEAPPDGYSGHVRAVAAEQQRKRAEQTYRPPSLAAIAAIANGGPPVDAADLQALTLENISVAQDMVRGSDVDWYRGFFLDNGRHKNEDACRDELIKMLRAIDSSLGYIPESHGADDKRADIVVRASERLILPIEIKGQWHRHLWTAADAQLDHLYVNDWRAERGIFLVLWFGDAVSNKASSAGTGAPRTPDELRDSLRAVSRAARDGRVEIVVFDLARPVPSMKAG